MHSFPDRLEIGGRTYAQVCVRRNGAAVYRGEGTYLRVGPPTVDEVALHRRLLAEGYPVAEILEVGEHERTPYFVEESLGPDTWGDLHEERTGDVNPTPDLEFWELGDVLLRWAEAQVRGGRPWTDGDLSGFLGVDRAVELVPALATSITAAYAQATRDLRELPGAWQHDDLHGFNVCAGGVIDVEGVGWAAAGYDVTTSVLEPSLAGARWDDGSLELAWFTHEQVREFLARLDDVFVNASAPPPSTLLDALLVCRAISKCSRPHRDTSVTRRRRDTLARLLPSYLETGHLPLAFVR